MANLLDKASIILTPTAYSDGKMHSAKPIVSTNPSIGDFDFARASVGTRVNEQGLIEEVASGLPRIDYTDGSGSWLLEPTATNLVLTSDGGVYGSFPASETLTISPYGTNNAVIPTPNANSDRYEQSVTGGTYATNTLLTYSWYRKRISTPVQPTYVGDLSIQGLVNLTISEATKQIESDINGFDRFQVVVQITDGSLVSTFRAYFGVIVGIGNSSIAYFGHQLEQNSYATSYIKTVGTTQTRVADTASGAGNSTVINSTEGTLYAEFSLLSQDGVSDRTIALQGQGQNCRIRFLIDGTLRWTLVGNNTTIARSLTITNTNINKVAIRYSSASASIWINGLLVDTALNGMTYTALDEITMNGFYSKTKSVQVYTTALSDAELTSLTTI